MMDPDSDMSDSQAQMSDSSHHNQEQQHHHQQQQQQQHHSQQQQQQQHHHHLHHHHQQQQHQANILEKLDPDKNGMALVPKEITSSTLTTRLKGVCKINRLIDHSNDLCHSFTELEAQAKYQECINKFRDWILRNKIIEHIFGPNCHVEIIKQSHTILNFVAYSLNDEHVNVIWSASLLKHCGRQVLDLITSLVRFMRTGPVLHLYWLVKNLNIEDHSEHTLLLTSHILRFIWSHSPCINQVQLCNLQKSREQRQGHSATINQANELGGGFQHQQEQHYQQHLLSQHFINVHQQHHQQRGVYGRPLVGSGGGASNNGGSGGLETTLARGGEGHQPAEDVKRSVVDQILKSITDNSSSPTSSQQKQSIDVENSDHVIPIETDTTEQEWLRQWKGGDFLDNTSDVSACCSDEKNMGDFDDDAQGFIQDENTIGNEGSSANSSSSELYNPITHHSSLDTTTSKSGTINGSSSRSAVSSNHENRAEIIGCLNDSTSTSRDSESKFRISLGDQNVDHFQQLPLESIAHFKELKKISEELSSTTSQFNGKDLKGLSEYNLANISEPGKTLLWDLLQDGKIEHLASNLHIEIENVLVNLVMSFGDRYIRYKFIEACLENLSTGTSVIISLRLLPKLMSFNTITRNLFIPAINETHTIVLWAEREYNMSQNFFKNLVEYCNQRQQLLYPQKQQATTNCPNLDYEQARHLEEYGDVNYKSFLFSHIDKIITRMSFLTFIYSKPFSPETMKLSREQMDQLWDCLASDNNPRCSDVLFQWIYQQAVGDDFHGINDELLDYILKHKLPTLKPQHFRLRGLKLLEQLLWIRQDYECCHDLEHPATRLLWDIGLKAADDEVSMAAIRILNHFYIYTNHQKSTKCDKGINFMNHCMDQLQSSLTNLTNMDESKDINRVLDVMQKVILLIRTHLEVFKAHWSFYLRILQLNNEADLVSHRLNAYETIKLTMTVRLVCQAASSMDKTTIEVQAGDFVGELRAEIVKWWYSQVDQTFFNLNSNQFSPPSSSSSSNSPSSTSSASNVANTKSNQHQEESEGELQKQQQENKNPNRKSTINTAASLSTNSSTLNSFTEFLLANHHSLRLLSHNQEIPFEWDERQINELDFKDMQVIYVLNDIRATTVESNDDMASDKSNESSQPMPKTDIPSLILLRYEYFERLMEADRLLGSFQSKNPDLTNRAKTLSRRVWEIIQILPTCPHYKEDLKRCGMLDEDWRLKTTQCSNLLSAECPQRLLYSLQIIDILKSSSENPNWGGIFIRKGGLADIYDVFTSQKLLPDANEEWNEWLQECLAYLLKLLFQFGTKPLQSPANDSSSSSSSSKLSISNCSTSRTLMTSSTSIKRVRRNRGRMLCAVEDRLPIPLFSDELLKLLANTDLTFNKLIWILKSSALCKSQSDQYYFVTMSSRAMIVHHVMSFLSSWCKSDPKFPKFQISNYEQLVKALTLDDTDSSTRREACMGFYKLHQASTTRSVSTSIETINSTLNSSLNSSSDEANNSSSTNNETINDSYNSWPFSSDLLKCLIKFLPIAEAMKPPKPIRNYVTENDYIKELNSPGCKDYFWLICRLIESPATMSLNSDKCPSLSADKKSNTSMMLDDSKPISGGNFTSTTFSANVNSNPTTSNTTSTTDSQSRAKCKNTTVSIPSSPTISSHELCWYLSVAIENRPTYETRDFSVEDDTLRGMLNMMVMSLRRDQTFRYTIEAFDFIHYLYEYLFAPPDQNRRYLPKCKSPGTRSTAFELMLALVERCPKNYYGLLELLLADTHSTVVKGTYPTDYWPHEDCRSEVGFVGLINLGATCYLATCMQHLFMIPNLRYAILSIEDTKSIRHGEIIRELQKIFTFMLESERKAYNPRNFCKVYTMDNHPLNIAEQTDMTEFLTDLITKLEESSPELRQIIKGLFSGTLSNNVVSLDCPHISRTTEEFYTLRVQVADMRNLNDSLDELTVKDTLEGDNMYTCSTCEKKVRAEKRACITKLPRILCFNTMRYTFNMATMTKEKVNTHFSFPLKLDMADYLEENLMKRQQSSNAGSHCSSNDSTVGSSSSASDLAASKSDINQQQQQLQQQQQQTRDKSSSCPAEKLSSNPIQSSTRTSSPCSSSASTSAMAQEEKQELDTMYELIGVTVHTGNADGGHYYCFIRDCEDQSSDKPRWYLFNDAEVKPFDDSHIGTECYGGELTTKSYDAINDRFMDFSIEKTNSAYMLFYKRVDYKYQSKSVALRYLESDTERVLPNNAAAAEQQQLPTAPKLSSSNNISHLDVKSASRERLNTNCDKAADEVEMRTEVSEGEEEEVDEEEEEEEEDEEEDEEEEEEEEVEVKSASTTPPPPPPPKTTPTTTTNESDSDANSMKQQQPENEDDERKERTQTNVDSELDFNELCQRTYEDFKLPKYLSNWIWSDNIRFSRDKNIFEHNFFNFMWQICANLPRTLHHIPAHLAAYNQASYPSQATDDEIAIKTVHLSIAFVLGVLMNSRERPNLSNWTELIRKHFNSSKPACDWLMHLIDDEETWLKQMLLKCPIEMVRQLFQRLCNDLTGSKQHKKLRLIR